MTHMAAYVDKCIGTDVSLSIDRSLAIQIKLTSGILFITLRMSGVNWERERQRLCMVCMGTPGLEAPYKTKTKQKQQQ